MDIRPVLGEFEHRNEEPRSHPYLMRYDSSNSGDVDTTDEDGADSDEELLGSRSSPPVLAEKKRWYILFVFCVLTAVLSVTSNTWAPIGDSAKFVFGWSNHVLALVGNLRLIGFLLSMPFSAWVLDVEGLRTACLLAAFLQVMASGIRCITAATPLATYLIGASQLLLGFAGPITLSGVPLLSATWFPVGQRATSSAVGIVMNIMGLSFLIGPFLVPDPPASHLELDSKTYHQIKEYIMKYMYYSFGASAFVFLLILVYFPAKPSSPPSASAGMDRVGYKQGIKAIAKNLNFWILVITYSVPNAALNMFTVVIDVILADIGISQQIAGRVGITAALASCLSALFMGYLADECRQRKKLITMVMYSVASLACITFALIYYKVIVCLPLVFVTISIAAIGILASSPLFYFMASDATFPVGEAVTNGALNILSTILSIVFLFVLTIPEISTHWINWCCVGSLVISVCLLLLFEEQHQRVIMDLRRHFEM